MHALPLSPSSTIHLLHLHSQCCHNLSASLQLRAIAGIIYADQGEYLEALQCCAQGGSLECMAVCVQVYLRMDRPDQADKMAAAMMQQDEDASISQLCSAWACLAQGGAKVMDACYTFQELAEKYTWTAGA